MDICRLITSLLNCFFPNFQVSIEYGLCEMLNSEAIRPGLAPRDGNWGFNISELEKMLPAGTVDHAVERMYKEVYLSIYLYIYILYVSIKNFWCL